MIRARAREWRGHFARATSGIGTFRMYATALTMSGHRGEADMMASSRYFRK